jgi:hypothetical protein
MILWQLPQNLLGLLLVKIYKAKQENEYYKSNIMKGSISLGKYIIIGKNSNKYTLKHEIGHQKQSKILGPLYLLLVGIPSIIRSIIWNKFKLPYKKYYMGYPEKWADKLAGIER